VLTCRWLGEQSHLSAARQPLGGPRRLGVSDSYCHPRRWSVREGGTEDLSAVVDGIRFVRRLTAKLKAQGLIASEELPGERLESDGELQEFVRSHAWGHHASCTCAIGPVRNGVLGSDFRVHGVRGLRVVDASVFPRIPGFFIASAVYMVGEKAADAILASRE